MRSNAISGNVNEIYSKISSASVRAGRSPEEVKLVAVTKTVSASVVRDAVSAGLRDFGENRVQEAQGKISALKSDMPDSGVIWHLIGHLQKNKARTAVDLFDLIQSVDTTELARTINRFAERSGKIQRILLQVKLSGEESKFGMTGEYMDDFIEEIGGMKNLKLEGLMTIPPFFDDPEMARPYFRRLREIRDEMEQKGIGLKELSMGMSNDFEVAIEEGATMVRIGTAIFGERRTKEAV